ncbi:hypothetical protein M9458_022033, partial [Cirrhinus mrigala]
REQLSAVADAEAAAVGAGGHLTPFTHDMDSESSSGYSGLREEHVVKASALLRLYCALMGIAGL